MKNKLISLALVIIMILTLFAAAGCGEKKTEPAEDTNESAAVTGDTTPVTEAPVTDAPDTEETEPELKIVDAETRDMEYEEYDNGLVSLSIPKGWKVDLPGTDYIHYTFKVYDPDDEDHMFLFSLKLEGFMKTEEARSTYASMDPDATFSKLAPIDPQTTEAFYKVWNTNARLANELDFKYDFFPYLNDFEVVENLCTLAFGGDVLRATYTDDGDAMQGLFTTSVYSAGSYYMYGVDLAPLSAYHTIMMTAPDDEFVNWQPIYDYCIGTVQFSSAFISGFSSEETTLVSTIIANQKVYDEISDMIMDSWERRSASYDIISQKRSDATLGYERVYDTDTGDVYRAYNGFTDGYSGSRFETVTDDMYTAPISGYIER